MERRQWFYDRIGKVVYRNKTTCKCAICARVYEEGLKIHDKIHADYLQEWEIQPDEEGHAPIRYFDTLEARNQYEQSLLK